MDHVSSWSPVVFPSIRWDVMGIIIEGTMYYWGRGGDNIGALNNAFGWSKFRSLRWNETMICMRSKL